jgi:quinoprotein glucose dehydrogenase
MANRGHLIPRSEEEQTTLRVQGDPGVDTPAFFPYPQKGTPYAAQIGPWLSKLVIPCQRPPWGLLTAVDLSRRAIVWQRPLGDATRSGPFGMPSMLPIPIGTPNQGGALTTAGGLTFIAATLDEQLRAYDTQTGDLLWETELPAGGHAGPATYLVNGEQYVVVAAGGHTLLGTRSGDYLLAYRLRR